MTVIANFADENLRRLSARATRRIALRYGRSLPMWIGAGYPKSGTVWLCQLMGAYLGVPYPQNYRMPIAMRSVVHAHWLHDARMPPTAYIVRDGRDVMVSFYFFHMRALTVQSDPSTRSRLQRRYDNLFGPGFDPADARLHLPRFIEHMMESAPVTHGTTWAEHVRSWTQLPREDVGVVRYEDLLADTPKHLAAVMSQVTGEPPKISKARAAATLYDFASRSGRSTGDEDRTSFLRKGVAGDWRNHFSREAGEVFDHFSGDVLRDLGYVQSDRWFDDL